MANSVQKNLNQLSIKHMAVNKDNTKVVIAAAVAASVLVFSIFACKSIIATIAYQNKVISERKKAAVVLDENIAAIEQLKAAYVGFDTAQESYIGTSDKNSKIILDALPGKYDFPASATSIEYIVRSSGLTLDSIEGTDEELSAIQSSANPKPVEILFDVQASGDYASVQRLIAAFAKSIRPFSIQSMSISSNEGVLSVSMSVKTNYQPAKQLDIEDTVITSSGTADSRTQNSANDGQDAAQEPTGGVQ